MSFLTMVNITLGLDITYNLTIQTFTFREEAEIILGKLHKK